MHTTGNRIANGTVIEADVCIVGGGAAGSVMAHELGRAGVKVVLLEAGGLGGPGKAQALYKGTSGDPEFHLPPDRDRTRGLGGTSAMWGGRCMPYDPIDFEARDYMPGSGWPLTRDDLDPWYRKAQVYADCGGFAYDSAEAGLDGSLIEGFESDAVDIASLERWSPPAHFGKVLGDDLKASSKVRLITGAVATGLIRDDASGRIEGVRVHALNGRRAFRVAAGDVVLAGGGLETTRLLLETGGDDGPAIGDHSGWLGRGYMCHVGGVISQIRFNEGQKIIFGYERDADGIYVRRRITLTPEAQRAHRAPNFYALLDRPFLEDASHDSALLSLAYLAKRVVQRQSKTEIGGGKFAHYRKHIRNLVMGAPEVLTVLPKFGRDRFLTGRRVPSLLLSSRDNRFYLYFHAEQSPDPESRVMLSSARDTLGQRRLHIEARVSDGDLEGILRGHKAIGAALEAGGAGRLEFTSDDPMAALRACKCTLGHHIGTTRMAARPEDGVVDAAARVHGVPNLWIASSSVFPTSSQAHPTLTILALALRLSHTLKGRHHAEAAENSNAAMAGAETPAGADS